jgi:peptide/nickel transport system substrate-binding protein
MVSTQAGFCLCTEFYTFGPTCENNPAKERIRMRVKFLLAALLGLAYPFAGSAQTAPSGQLTIAQGTDAVTMDPHNTTQMTAMQPFNFVYNKLVNRDKDMKLVPELAESWRSLDERTWEVRLRKGVKFHNGEDFNAESVKFTLDRVRIPAATQVSSGFTTIEEVKTPDPYVVHIVTKQPDPLLPARLAQWGAQMLPPGYFKEVGAEGLARKAIGTGPYKFSQWRKDDMLVFEANTSYWGEPPKFQRVVFRPIRDELARVSALTAGEVDMVVNIPVDFVDRIGGNAGTYVAETAANATDVFLMGSDAPLKDARVRLALNLAIDRKKLSESLFRGYAKPISQGAAPTDFGYNPNIPPYPYDPERAKKLLAEAGYPNGFTVAVQSSTGYIIGDSLVVEAVVEMLKKVGIQAQPQFLEIARRAEMLGKRAVTGLLLANPGSTTFDADGIVWRLLHPDAIAGVYWPQSQKDSEFFKMMETARYSIDPAKRQEIYYKAAEILHNDPPWLYLWQEFSLYGVSCKLAFNARIDTMILPTGISVDTAQKGGGRCK